MSQGLPWSIDDLEPEARAAARRAARRAGMSVDDWLDMTLREQASARSDADDDDFGYEPGNHHNQRPATASNRFAPSRLSREEAEILLAKAEANDRRARESDARTAEMLDSITRWMEKTESRIEASERTTNARQERTATVMADAIKTVGSRLNDVERRSAPERRAYPELRSVPDRRVNSGHSAPVPPPLSRANLADAVAEIRERQRDLDSYPAAPRGREPDGHESRSHSGTGRRPPPDMNQPGTGDPGIRALREELRSLGAGFETRAASFAATEDMRGELLKLRRDIAQGATRSNAEMASTLSALITKLDRQPIGGQADHVSRSLARLEQDVAKLASGRGAGGEAVERQIARLHQRLDQMGSITDSRSINTLSHELADIRSRLTGDLTDRIALLSSDLSGLKRAQISADEFGALRQAVEDVRANGSRSPVISAPVDLGPIEAHLAALAARMDRMPAADFSHLDKRFEALLARFDDFARHSEIASRASPLVEQRLDDIHAMLERAPAPPSGVLERQIESLAARLENLAASNGLVQIVAKDGKPATADLRPIETMLKRIEQGVSAKSPPADGKALDDLARQVAGLSRRLDQQPTAAPANDLAPIEAMLRTLHDRFENARAPEADNHAIRALENQISLLARRMEDSVPPSSDPGLDKTLRELVNAVAAMQQSHDVTSGRVTADAVASAVESGIERLHASNSTVDRRIQSGFDTVQAMLEQIAGRLASLEGAQSGLHTRKETSSPPVAEQSATRMAVSNAPQPDRANVLLAAAAETLLLEPAETAQSAAAKAGTNAVTETVLRAEREPAETALRPARRADAAQARPGPDMVDQPLEPGSGRPRQARPDQFRNDQNKPDAAGREVAPVATPVAGNDPQTLKANYIAAARRAVQAAAAEAKAASGDERSPKSAKPASASRIKALFEKRKKPILLGLAAAILAMGSAQVISTSLFQDTAPTTKPKVSTATPDKASAAPAADKQASSGKLVSPEQQISSDKTASAGKVERITTKVEPVAGQPVSTQAVPSLLGPESNSQRISTTVPATALSAPLATNLGLAPANAAVPADDAASPAVAPSSNVVATVTALPEIPANMGSAGLRKAAMGGDARAVFDLATRMADGRGMNRDTKLALKLFERTAAAGLVPAQFRIGNMYEKGVGTTRDVGLARLWYERAAEKGNSKAMHNLAVLYAEGATGKPDYPMAAEWFRKAAELGVRDSQYNLAILQARGLGAAQDLTQSYIWFAVAAAQGDEDSGKKRDEVALKLSPADLTSARQAIEKWQPKASDPQANEVALPAKGWDEPMASPTQPKKPARNSQG
jgi:localization factor PodJL